jgi:phospholipase C
VVSVPCSIGGTDQARAKEHDVLDMVTSGYLDRLGFDYRPATPAHAFREPDKVVSTLVASS